MQFSNRPTAAVAIADGTIPDAEVIANTGYQVPMNWGGIFAPPSTTSPSQLKGKTLAGLVGGGVPDAITKLLMNSAGQSPGQYSVVNFSSDTAYYAASAAGETAATWAQLPLIPQLQKEHWHNLIPLTKDLAYTQDDWLIADKSWAAAHPQATEDLLKCWAAATKVARSTDATTRHQAAAAIYQFDDTTINAVLTSLRSIGLAQGLQPVSEAELQRSVNFLNGSPVPQAKVTKEINNTYLTKSGIDIPVANELGTTTS
jgi:ABC-type nitrate/sulfonate/bicarbonate transport system substrate-binding protein